MTKLSKKKVKEAIKGTMGIIIAIAEKCGVTREHLSRWLHKPKNKDILELVRAERERIIDTAEIGLNRLVINGEFPAIKYLLSTRGRKRGYVEKQEIEHLSEDPIKIDVKISEEIKKLFEQKS